MANEFDTRLKARYDELKWLYCELYNNPKVVKYRLKTKTDKRA